MLIDSLTPFVTPVQNRLDKENFGWLITAGMDGATLETGAVLNTIRRSRRVNARISMTN